MIDAAEYQRRLRNIRLLATDVDGVLTDGSILYLGADREAKIFQVRDGSAAYIARLLGLDVVVITARESDAVARRFSELPVKGLHQGVFDKLGVILEYEASLELEPGQIAYVGDDLVDLPSIRHVGLGITVADGHPRVRREADRVTRRLTGDGCAGHGDL